MFIKHARIDGLKGLFKSRTLLIVIAQCQKKTTVSLEIGGNIT